MLKIYRDNDGAVRSAGADDDLPGQVIWMDLFNPDEKEIEFIQRRAKVRVPTRDALSEIEASSRLSREGKVLYLSAPVIGHATIGEAELSPAGFIVGPDFLVTVRYESLPTFDAVAERLQQDETLASGMGVFVALLEAIVDRGADVLEHLAAAVDEVSKTVFKGNLKGSASPRSANFTLRRALSKVGALGDRSSKARDVLLGVGRMASFTLDVCHDVLSDDFRDRLHAVTEDVASLSDYETHLSDKTQFLLDAVLGFITIEQNDIFKVLTIASVVGVPPTLMAGIWGMNFKFMPELSWTWGYPFAWAIIILSAVAPLFWFWRRGWF
ncbi:magnesium transporter (plasmid) [Rhizobium acidisoli]|uniref:Magnesium transport protein CorA n=1 Tax=Rhizobium acidisoli TaxID=1538158 RepID=A0AAE5WT87_9HYPH|nr:magnesium transporter CorA family protein [Rhizobium acidisoli]KPH06228.1 magnesium transporter [Rhizobium acidisoli]QAS82166.1 magnesium transporter [Rhizobium acidisoli]